MNRTLELFVHYDPLDKKWVYQISSSTSGYMDQWLWFFLGKLINDRTTALYPYAFSWRKSRRLRRYENWNGAKEFAKKIAKAINDHKAKVRRAK